MALVPLKINVNQNANSKHFRSEFNFYCQYFLNHNSYIGSQPPDRSEYYDHYKGRWIYIYTYIYIPIKML